MQTVFSFTHQIVVFSLLGSTFIVNYHQMHHLLHQLIQKIHQTIVSFFIFICLYLLFINSNFTLTFFIFLTSFTSHLFIAFSSTSFIFFFIFCSFSHSYAFYLSLISYVIDDSIDHPLSNSVLSQVTYGSFSLIFYNLFLPPQLLLGHLYHFIIILAYRLRLFISD